SAPVRAWVMRVSGHGGSAVILGVRKQPAGGYVAEGIRFLPKSGDSVSVQLLAPDLRVEGADEMLARVDGALTAKVTTSVAEEEGDQRLHLRPITFTTGNAFERAHVEDASGRALDRAWFGYPGNDQPERLSIELALATLERSLPRKFVVRAPPEEDGRLPSAAWKAEGTPWFADDPLLSLAASLGSPELLDRIIARLGSKKTNVQALAVDALAAITGWDARKDASGNARPLPEVVADYRGECTRKRDQGALPDAKAQVGVPPYRAFP